MRRVLVLGPPRSGSTWISEILGASPGAVRLHEPDNDGLSAAALIDKAGLGRYPVLNRHSEAPTYDSLWRHVWSPSPEHVIRTRTRRPLALIGAAAHRLSTLDEQFEILDGTPTGRAAVIARVLRSTARHPTAPAGDVQVVKSVHSAAAAEFVTARTDAQVVVVRRNPLNAVPSWLDLGWRPQRLAASRDDERSFAATLGTTAPSPDAPLLERQAWSYTALTRSLDLAAERHRDWVVVQHEDLCEDPVARFRDLFERLDLEFTDDVVGTLDERNRPATGYETKRVAGDQVERWRERLGPDQVASIRNIAASLSVDC